jgi:hypothetical protein
MTTLTNLDRSNHLLAGGLEITALFLGWQDPQSELWLPVGKMTWDTNRRQYYFAYTHGMKQAVDISPIQKNLLWGEPERLEQVQISKGVNLKFKPRMPLARLDETKRELDYYGLSTDAIDPILFVSRSGGRRHSDSYDVFPEIQPDLDGKYHFYFIPLKIATGDRHQHEYINRLAIGTELECSGAYLSDLHGMKIGKLPGYIANLASSHPHDLRVEVAKINSGTDWWCFQLICHATIQTKPFVSQDYQTLAQLPSHDC